MDYEKQLKKRLIKIGFITLGLLMGVNFVLWLCFSEPSKEETDKWFKETHWLKRTTPYSLVTGNFVKGAISNDYIIETCLKSKDISPYQVKSEFVKLNRRPLYNNVLYRLLYGKHAIDRITEFEPERISARIKITDTGDNSKIINCDFTSSPEKIHFLVNEK